MDKTYIFLFSVYDLVSVRLEIERVIWRSCFSEYSGCDGLLEMKKDDK